MAEENVCILIFKTDEFDNIYFCHLWYLFTIESIKIDKSHIKKGKNTGFVTMRKPYRRQHML